MLIVLIIVHVISGEPKVTFKEFWNYQDCERAAELVHMTTTNAEKIVTLCVEEGDVTKVRI